MKTSRSHAVLVMVAFFICILPAWSADPTVLVGKWKLNKKESDNPKEKFEHGKHGPEGGGQWGGHQGSHRGGMGGPGMGGPGGDREHGGSGFQPPETMTIAFNAPDIKITDENGKDQHYYTDGRKTEREVGKDRIVTYTSKWEDDQLVVQSQTPRGDPLTESYYLSPDGKKLYVKLRMQSPMSEEPITVIRVYDSVPAEEKK